MKRIVVLLLSVFALFAEDGNNIDAVTSASKRYNVNGGTAYEDNIEITWYAGYSNGQVFFSYGTSAGSYTDTVEFNDVSKGNHNEKLTGFTPETKYYFNLWGYWRGIKTKCLGTFETTGSGVVTFTVNVVNGTGSGDYEAGQTVSIVAKDSTGFDFDIWTGDSDLLDDASEKSTSFTMPEKAVSLTATYKEESIDTINGSKNFTQFQSWGAVLDPYGSTVDTGDGLITDGIVKAKLTIVDSDTGEAGSDDDKWAYGSLDCQLPEDGSSLDKCNYLKITYKTDDDFKLVLPQGALAESGTSYETGVVKTGGSFKTTLFKLNESTFSQPDWFTGDKTPLNLAEVSTISFAVKDDNSTGSIEVKELIAFNYEGTYLEVSVVDAKATSAKSALVSMEQNRLTLSLPKEMRGTIKLMNVHGRVLASQTGLFTTGVHTLPVRNLSRGVYLVQFIDANGNRLLNELITQ